MACVAIVQVPGASVINDHQVAALFDIPVQCPDHGVVCLTMNLIWNDQPCRMHFRHRIQQCGIAYGLKMEPFFFRGINPHLNLWVLFVCGIGKQQQDGVSGDRRPVLVAIDHGSRAGEQNQRYSDRQLRFKHGAHGAAVTFEQAPGSVWLVSPILASTAWNADSSSTFQFELKRRGSERESQHAALVSSPNLTAVIATSPHGCGSDFLFSQSPANRFFQLVHASRVCVCESMGMSASQGYTWATTSG